MHLFLLVLYSVDIATYALAQQPEKHTETVAMTTSPSPISQKDAAPQIMSRVLTKNRSAEKNAAQKQTQSRGLAAAEARDFQMKPRSSVRRVAFAQPPSLYRLTELRGNRLLEHRQRLERARIRLERYRVSKRPHKPSVETVVLQKMPRLPRNNFIRPRIIVRKPGFLHSGVRRPLRPVHKHVPQTIKHSVKPHIAHVHHPGSSLGTKDKVKKFVPYPINGHYGKKTTTHLKNRKPIVNIQQIEPVHHSQSGLGSIQGTSSIPIGPTPPKLSSGDLSLSSSLLRAQPFRVRPSGIRIEQIYAPPYTGEPISYDSPILQNIGIADSFQLPHQQLVEEPFLFSDTAVQAEDHDFNEELSLHEDIPEDKNADSTLFYSSVKPIKFKPKSKPVEENKDKNQYVDLTGVLHQYIANHQQQEMHSRSETHHVESQPQNTIHETSESKMFREEGSEDAIVNIIDSSNGIPLPTWNSLKKEFVPDFDVEARVRPVEGYEQFKFAGQAHHDEKGPIFVYENEKKNQIILPNSIDRPYEISNLDSHIEPIKFDMNKHHIASSDNNVFRIVGGKIRHKNTHSVTGISQNLGNGKFLEQHGFSFEKPHAFHTKSEDFGKNGFLNPFLTDHKTHTNTIAYPAGKMRSFSENLSAHETRVFEPSVKIPGKYLSKSHPIINADKIFHPPQISYGGFKPILKSNPHEELIYYSRRKRGSDLESTINEIGKEKYRSDRRKREAKAMVMGAKEDVTLNPLESSPHLPQSSASSDEQYRILADVHKTMKRSLELSTENQTTTENVRTTSIATTTTTTTTIRATTTTPYSALRQHTHELIKQLKKSGSIANNVSSLPNMNDRSVTGYLIPKKGGQVLPLNDKTKFIVRGSKLDQDSEYGVRKVRKSKRLRASYRKRTAEKPEQTSIEVETSTETQMSNEDENNGEIKPEEETEMNTENEDQENTDEDEDEDEENYDDEEENLLYDDPHSGLLFPHREPYGHHPYHHYRPYRHSVLLQIIRRVARGFNRLLFGHSYADHIEYEGLYGAHRKKRRTMIG